MKNLKKLSRENLKSIKGGYKMCIEELPNYGCGDGECCYNNACRRFSDLPAGSCMVQIDHEIVIYIIYQAEVNFVNEIT